MRITVGQSLALAVTGVLAIITLPDMLVDATGYAAGAAWLIATALLIMTRASAGLWFAIKAASVLFAWAIVVVLPGAGGEPSPELMLVGAAIIAIDVAVFRLVPGARHTAPRVKIES